MATSTSSISISIDGEAAWQGVLEFCLCLVMVDRISYLWHTASVRKGHI